MAVNTQDMLLVHGVFRREFHEAVELIEGVRPGDVARAQVVGNVWPSCWPCITTIRPRTTWCRWKLY
jgi:hypothetical protein